MPFPTSPSAEAKPDKVKYGFQPALRFGVEKVSPKGEYNIVGEVSLTANCTQLAIISWGKNLKDKETALHSYRQTKRQMEE